MIEKEINLTLSRDNFRLDSETLDLLEGLDESYIVTNIDLEWFKDSEECTRIEELRIKIKLRSEETK